MNKGEFVSFIAKDNNCSKAEAERVIDIFTKSVIKALSNGENIALVGFGSYYVSDVAARTGRNPRTGEKLEIAAFRQPKFKAGQRLKDACN